MHEVGLCEGIVAAVSRRAGDRPVARVRVRAGVLLRVVEPSLQQAFTLLAAGTSAADATVELVEVPAQLRCQACRHQAETRDALATCPQCGSGDVVLTGGEELLLESITLREPAPGDAATAGAATAGAATAGAATAGAATADGAAEGGAVAASGAVVGADSGVADGAAASGG